MKEQAKNQEVYTIWQAKGIDYTQSNAYRYWMQLYKNFNPLNYLNSQQRVDIIQDLSYQDSIQFQGKLPRFVNDKIFKLTDKEEYFLLRECRIPTIQEIICHQAEKMADKRWQSNQYNQFKRQLDQQAAQIAQKGYYVNLKKPSRKKHFGIFRIHFKHGQQIQFLRYDQNIRNSIQVQFNAFQQENLNNFTIAIRFQPNLSPEEESFHRLFPDIQSIKKSLLEVPLSSKFKLQDKTNYITYNYQEPKKQRFNETTEPHLVLAFQGGGVKGVSYVGVYNQIIKLQKSVKQRSNMTVTFPIKSVIGSSAGGILSLAFTTGIEEHQMLQLCLMMDTFIEDLLIETEQQGRKAENNPDEQFNKKNVIPIKPGYFSEQADNMKNIVHDLGLVEDSLFEILVQTLKEPSIQDKLLKILVPLAGSSISSLITFKQEKEKRGEEWVCCCCGCACCCCIKSVNDIKSINYYGILYMALMSGQALQNVVAYLLVLFLTKAANKGVYDLKFNIKFETLLRRKNFRGIHTANDVKNQAKKVIDQYKNYKLRKQKAKEQGIRLLKSQMVYPTLPLMQFAKTITMEEYYSLTQIEFTCTSVDLNDYVQRFFNHKTAPKLPVCKAVQMTGSFPVAFQSQRWKRQWGYYYVTYDNTRKEIDLTGHNFSDGGLLANFPIRFIDNQKIRPMYFSHKINANTTLYGFGLQQLPDFPENIPQKQISDAVDSFKKQFLLRLAPKLLKYLICCSSKRYYQKTKFQLIQFLLSLVSAMKLSDKRLNVECFQPEIITTKMPLDTDILLDKDRYLEKLNTTEKAVQQFKARVDEHFAKTQVKFLQEELKCLHQLIFQSQKAQGQTIKTARKIVECHLGANGVFSSAFSQYKSMLNEKNVSYKFENNEGLLLTNQYKNELLYFLQKFQQASLKGNLDLTPLKNDFAQWIGAVTASISEIRSRINNRADDDPLQKLVFVRQQNLRKQINSRYKFTPYLNKIHKQMLGKNKGICDIKNLSINSLVEHETYKKINKISKRVQKIMNQRIDLQLKQAKQKGIPYKDYDIKLHVILQAFSISHYYYPHIVEIIQTVLFQINTQRSEQFAKRGQTWKKLSINILSCTDFQALYGVLYALGMKTSQIMQKMSEIKPLFKIKQNLNEQYNSEIWLKASLFKLQTLLKRQWEQKFNIIEQLEEQQRLHTEQFTDQIKNCELNEDYVIKHRISQTEIQTYMEKLLDYVSTSFEELNKLEQGKRRNRIAQLLNLNSFKDKHQKYQKKGKRVLLDIMSHLADLFIMISQYIMKTQQYLNLPNICPNDDSYFKGMVLHSMVSTLQYKKYIYSLLKQRAIDPSITLQKFYHLAEKKVILNFNCIKVNEGRFSLINKNSRPNMPLWAALMAAASLPYMQGNFASREEWQNDQKITNLQQNKANMYFNKITKQDEKSHLSSYISGNFISSLPIEILSNNKVIKDKLLSEQSNEKTKKIIELSFSFEHQQQKKHAFDFKSFVSNLCVAMQGKTKFLNCWDFCKYFCEFICCCCCSLEGVGWYFSDIMNQIQLMKLIMIRVDSNDNFIYHTYKQFLIKLPLRIGTLQFDKITTDKPYLKDTIRQAQQVVRQLTDTVIVRDNKIQYGQFAKNTTLQISYVVTPKANFYRVKFISYTIWRTLKAKYTIFYKFDQPTFTRVEYDYIDIPAERAQNEKLFLELKYIYCSPTYRIRSRTHKIQLSNLVFPNPNQYQTDLKFIRAIFHFPYRNVLVFGNQSPLRGKWDGIEFSRSYLELDLITNPKLDKPLLEKNSTVPQITIVTQIQNKSGSMFCTNCLPFKLKKQLNSNLRREKCYSCGSESKLLAMSCRNCLATYCFHCKIENFIGTHKDIKFSTVQRCCSKQHNLVFKSNKQSDLCLYCDKYFLSLWKDEECGIHLCQNCLILIPQVQIQDIKYNQDAQ